MPDAAWHNAKNARAEVRARAAFEASGGFDPERRAAEIAALPEIDFEGRALVQLTCQRCRRPRNLPRSVCWSLISLAHYRCVWCAIRG
jgi:hypothetical protein